jgi:hypothetical protein
MRLLAEVVVMAVAATGFCLLLAGFVMVARRGGWPAAMRSTAEGRWSLPRRLLLAGAALGALSGLLMVFLGLASRSG